MKADARRYRIASIIDNVPHFGEFETKLYSTGQPFNKNLCWLCFLAYNGITRSTGHRRKREALSGRVDFRHRSKFENERGKSKDKTDATQWIDSYASSTADYMPNKNHEQHLPDYNWKTVYRKMMRELKNNLQDNDPHRYLFSYPAFMDLIKQEFHYVKIRCYKAMGACDDCDDLDRMISSVRSNLHREHALRLKEEHLNWQTNERKKADKHVDKSLRIGYRKSMMIEIDGMDKSKTNIGKPAKLTKRTADLTRIDTHVTGVFVYDEILTPNLVTWYDRYPSGSDSVITILNETLVRHINLKGSLPPVLYLHCDNCSRENKNK